MECIICGKSVENQDKSVVQNPTKQGLQTIVGTAEKRRDIVGLKILERKEAILIGSEKVKYHQSCRKTYTSVQNIGSASTSGTQNPQQEISSKTTRSNIGLFNIRSMCLICNRSGPKKIKQKKEKLTFVQTGMYELFCTMCIYL